MNKHDTLPNITIDKLIFGGSGLATAPDGKKIIISGWAIPWAVVDLRILKVKNNRLEAQILRTVKKSPYEKEIPSGWQLYGGCKWLMIPYEKQIEIKAMQIKEAFHFLEKETENTVFHPIIPSPLTEHYRNKVEFSWGKYISEREGIHDEYRFGFHAPAQFDRIIDCTYCVLADDEINSIFHVIDEYARDSGFPTYDPKTQVGFWRHLVVRKGKKTDEIMLIFSVNGSFEEKVKDFFTEMVSKLSEKYPHIASIYFLENTGRADIVDGKLRLLYGKTSITDELLGVKFEIQPKSFFQTNSLGAEKLYSRVIDSIAGKWWTLLDLYAGTGTIGILLSKHFETVYSVELVESASADGKKNSDTNGTTNVRFINKKVEDFAKAFSEKGEKADTIILDPPRDGLHPSAIPHILSFGASEIIYVSCNPATLVRDLAIMMESEGDKKSVYKITDITPVDMFPHTHHIETIVRLNRI